MEINISTQRILKNIAYISGENTLKVLIALVSNIIVTRYLGPSDWGKFSYVISFTIIFLPFFSLGLDEQTITCLTQSPNNRDTIIGSAIYLRILGGVIGIILICISAFIKSLMGQEYGSEIFCIIIYACFMMARSLDPIKNYFETIVDQKSLAKNRTLIYFTSLVIKFIIIFFKKSWIYFVFISCLELLLISVLYIIKFKKVTSISNILKPQKVYWRKLFYPSFFTFINLFLFYIITKIDLIIIRHLMGLEVLGHYSLASKIVELLNFIPLAILSSTLSKSVATLKGKGIEAYKKQIHKLYFFIIVLAIVFAFSTYIIAPYFVDIVYGKKYFPAIKIIQLYGMLFLPFFIIITRTQFLIIQGSSHLNMCLTGLMVIIHIPMTYHLIKIYGVNGAIFSHLISFLSSYLILSVFSKKIRDHIMDYFQSFMLFKYYPMMLFNKFLHNKGRY